jgi:hypothetical protein
VSYCVNPIAVDLDEVRRVIGSKNKELFTRLKEAVSGGLEQIDGMLADRFDDDEDGDLGEPLTTADLLRQMILSEPYRDGIGFAYGYCFEALCEYFGERLNNGHWSAMRAEWFESVQVALGQAGLNKKQFSVDTLAFRGPPVALPEIDDFPNIGYLTRAEIASARPVLATADLSKVKVRGAVEAIEQIRKWLDVCAASNRDLVCTYA